MTAPCYVVLAHDDPAHVRRLTAALEPSPVVLHCDARTPANVYEAMIEGPGVVPVPRRATPWASSQAAFAELDAIRAALRLDGWDHLVVLQGSDYPIVRQATIIAALAQRRGRSAGALQPLPRAAWGRRGGLDRLRYRHWVVRRHMVRLPVSRRLPVGVVAGGGSVNKILSRAHAELVVALADQRPELGRFWRHVWAADESFVATLLLTALHDTGRSAEFDDDSLWFTDWGHGRRKSPAWLTYAHADALLGDSFALYARKFRTGRSDALLAVVDKRRRGLAAVR